MSMVINLVEDHNIYLCEGGPVYNGSVQPITYLTQWKIVGNSEVHGQEIWSCGEYNATDGKYHILVQPLGGSIADIALTEPLRMDNEVVDSIEFADNVATVTRNLASVNMGDLTWTAYAAKGGVFRMQSNLPNGKPAASDNDAANLLSPIYTTIAANGTYTHGQDKVIGLYIQQKMLMVYDSDYNQSDSATAFTTAMDGVELIYELATPTTELVDAPQIAEAESYTCVISQGGKAVEWSDFETE